MKAQCEIQMASKHSENKILKSRAGKDRDVSHVEMQSLLMKLKDLVPNVPRNKKLSKLEIIQYVIDYILDLQIALETHPAVVSKPASSVAVAASLAGISPYRQPLGVLPPSANTCAAQEVNQTEKVPSHLGEVITTTRPVSC